MAQANGEMRFSYCMLPDYPLTDSIEMIKVADELGYYACYSVTRHGTRICGACSRRRPTRRATSASAPT